MKKLLLTNNSIFINGQYDVIFTDSPFVIEKYKQVKYLSDLLDNEYHSKISDVREKGRKINQKIINEFFFNYKDDNVSIFDVNEGYTNIFINVYKLLKLIDLYPKHEITIAVTTDELYDYNSSNLIDRFVNAYYWIIEISDIQNIKLVCKNSKRDDLVQDHMPMDSWVLRLVDLDKKVLSYNLKKLLKLNKKKKNILIYKKSNVIREIEPYLYDLGFSFESMPKINTKFQKELDRNDEKKIHSIIDEYLDNNLLENTFKFSLYAVYKKIINIYLNQEIFLNGYIPKLSKDTKIVVTNTIFDFDRLIFKKKLQENGYKIIVVLHGMGEFYKRKLDLYGSKYSDINMLLCFNKSEKKHFQEYDSGVLVNHISTVQESKKPRFKKFKRYLVNRKLKINNKINVFYPSVTWPMNNLTSYNFRPSDKIIYDSEKKFLKLLSYINKRVIFKSYPRRNYIDSNPINEYAKKLDNIKVIEGDFDFRYVNSIGDVFIITVLGSTSTLTWMINLGKPIIYLHSNKSEFISEEALSMVKKFLIFIDRDNYNWEDNLKNILNKPYNELKKLWEDKKSDRDKYDEEWLTGKNLHAGKLGAKYINEFISQNFKK